MPLESNFHLPSEIWLLIFSYLTPEALVKVSQVDHNFYSLANAEQLWRQNIQQYFPFYQQSKRSLPDLELTQLSAKNTFQKACQKYQKKLSKFFLRRQIATSLLLIAIRSKKFNLDGLNNKKNFVFSASSSNPASEHFFSVFIFLHRLIWNAVPYPDMHPHIWTLPAIVRKASTLDRLKNIYPFINSEISVNALKQALTAAARIGDLESLKCLFKTDKIKQTDISKTFKIAAGHNRLLTVKYLLENYDLSINSIDKGWALRWAFKKQCYNVVEYLLEQFSHTFDFLPSLKAEAWSEFFKLDSLYVIIKRNGHGFSGETYLFIFQLDDEAIIQLELNHIEQIALWLQRKCFPTQQWNNPEFHKAYCCIMGNDAYQCLPAHIYGVGNLIASDQINQCFKAVMLKITQPELNIAIGYGKSQDIDFDSMKLIYSLTTTSSSENNSIVSISKGWALRWAFQNRYYKVAECLLEQFNFNFLPPLKQEAWSSSFRLNSNSFYVIIKRNGYGFSGQSHLIIIQLDDKKTVHLKLQHIEEIAFMFQKKCFPNRQQKDGKYHEAYRCITSGVDGLPTYLYCIGKLSVSEQINKKYRITMPKINQSELDIAINYNKSLTPAFNVMKLTPFLNTSLKKLQLQTEQHLL